MIKRWKLDFLGIDDGTRALPSSYTCKAEFDVLTPAEKTAIGKEMRNAWAPTTISAPMNASFQVNGGFNTKLFGKVFGGTVGITYNKSNRILELVNRSNSLSSSIFSTNYDFSDTRYAQDVSVGALGSLSLQINNNNRISLKSIINVNSSNFVTSRQGIDFNRDENIKGSELTFKQNTFFTSQLTGEHTLAKTVKFKQKWCPICFSMVIFLISAELSTYKLSNTTNPYRSLISNTLSQQSGSRIYQDLSDYVIYSQG